MKNMKVSCVALAAISLAACAASAKTVLWYHFNEQGNGYRPYHDPVRDDVIENAADPESLRGYAGGLNTSAAFTNNQVPTYTNDFPSCATWYDPVTGARGEDRRCLWMRSQYGDGSGESSVVLAEDDAKLHCANITVEFMAKYASSKNLLQQAHMIGMRNSSSANVVAWGIIFYTSGKAVLRVQTRNSAGTAQDGDKSFELADSANSGVLDGNWHHIAFTYDGTTAKLYVDYVLKVSKAWSYPLDYNAENAGMLSICGFDKATYGHWNGFIDEVRISDTALDPSQFIHPGGLVSASLAEKIAAVTDEDTALYLPFDSVEAAVSDPFFGGVGAPFVFNALNASNAPIIKATFPTSGMLPATSAVTVSNIVHSGIFATNSTANGGCWDFGVNSDVAGRSIHMTVNDYSASTRSHSATVGDFTLEFFLKTHARPSSLTYIAREICPGSTAWSIYLSSSKDVLTCALNSQSGSVPTFEAGFTQGVWHHVALVVNRTLRTSTYYVDGAVVGEVTGFDLKQAAGDVAECLHFSGYSASASADNFHNLSVDELRITKRALSPQEFLMVGANGTSALEPTRAWAGFEGNLKLEPRPEELLAGTAHSSISYSDDVPGDELKDGNYGVVRASNAKSLQFTGGGRAHFARNTLLEDDMDSMTVEFFAKTSHRTETQTWPYFIRMYANAAGADNLLERIWSVGYDTQSGNIYVHMDTEAGSTNHLERLRNSGSIASGRWRHVAATFEPKDTTNTLVTVYKDHRKVGEVELPGRPLTSKPMATSCMELGHSYIGLMDELRISKGVLTVDQMLHVARPGAVMLIR